MTDRCSAKSAPEQSRQGVSLFKAACLLTFSRLLSLPANDGASGRPSNSLKARFGKHRFGTAWLRGKLAGA
jgi:hypothetical protein